MPSPHPRKRTYIRRLLYALAFLFLAYLAVSTYIASSILHPVRKPLTSDPGKYGLAFENVEFRSEGDNILLKGWLIMHSVEAEKRGTIVILHGSNSVKDNYISMEVGRVLAQRGYDLFTFDFRGHGESSGDSTSLGDWETRDIAGALAYLETRGVQEVGVIGYSMGASAALLAAPAHPEMRAIVSDSAFAKLMTIVERQGSRSNPLAFLFNPGVILMSRLIFGADLVGNEPKRAVAALGSRPLLLIHSSGDDLIPLSEAYELQSAGAGNPNLELWVANGQGHVSTFADNKDEYLRRVTAFFDRWLAEK